MRQAQTTLAFETRGQDLLEITGEVAEWLRSTGLATGVLTLLCRHPRASLLLNENAAPAVRRGLLRWLGRAVPEGAHSVSHTADVLDLHGGFDTVWSRRFTSKVRSNSRNRSAK